MCFFTYCYSLVRQPVRVLCFYNLKLRIFIITASQRWGNKGVHRWGNRLEERYRLTCWGSGPLLSTIINQKQSDMAKVLNMEGEPQIEIDIRGIPFYKELLRTVERFHVYLHERMSHDDTSGYDYLEVKTKVGWVEFHFNKQKTK